MWIFRESVSDKNGFIFLVRLRKFVNLIESYWYGIASYCHPENKVSLGLVEGIYNEIRGLQRQAYGYRDEKYLKLKTVAAFLPPLHRNALNKILLTDIAGRINNAQSLRFHAYCQMLKLHDPCYWKAGLTLGMARGNSRESKFILDDAQLIYCRMSAAGWPRKFEIVS